MFLSRFRNDGTRSVQESPRLAREAAAFPKSDVPSPSPVTPTAPAARPIGPRKSVGFGDRLGLGTRGHLLAARRFSFAPVFVQATIRELERLRRTPAAVIEATRNALAQERFRGLWGADLGGIKTKADVDRALTAGFTWFTLDPSGFIEPRADHLTATELNKAVAEVVNEGVLPANWAEAFDDHRFEIEPGRVLHFTREDLHRAAAKYARAVAHAHELIRRLAQQAFADAWEVEIALTSAATPTTALEHLWIAIELQRRGAPIAAVAPRFAFVLEPGVDRQEDIASYADELAWHVAIARRCGSYKLSIHEAAHHESLLPVIGRVCEDRMHVKLSGLDYLEALRAVCRAAPDLFRSIIRFARSRFADDSEFAGVSTSLAEIDALLKRAGQASLERDFLDTPTGRQLLLTTAMSVLTATEEHQGRTFREAITAHVADHAKEHEQRLDDVHTRHLELLNQG